MNKPTSDWLVLIRSLVAGFDSTRDTVTPQDLHATVLHALGVPLSDDLTKNPGVVRPPFSTGKPVLGLFG